MRTSTIEKSNDKRSLSAANTRFTPRNISKFSQIFADNRPEAAVQRKIRDLAEKRLQSTKEGSTHHLIFKFPKNQPTTSFSGSAPAQLMKKWDLENGYTNIAEKPEGAGNPKIWQLYLHNGEELYIWVKDMGDFPDWEEVEAVELTDGDSTEDTLSSSIEETSTPEPTKTLGKKIKGISAGIMDKTISTVLVHGGKHIDNDHAEVLCEVGEDQWLRFSRNDSEDTAQFGASYERSAQTYPNVWFNKQAKPGTTVKSALEVFESVHGKFSVYETANCTDFANQMVKGLTGQIYKDVDEW